MSLGKLNLCRALLNIYKLQPLKGFQANYIVNSICIITLFLSISTTSGKRGMIKPKIHFLYSIISGHSLTLLHNRRFKLGNFALCLPQFALFLHALLLSNMKNRKKLLCLLQTCSNHYNCHKDVENANFRGEIQTNVIDDHSQCCHNPPSVNKKVWLIFTISFSWLFRNSTKAFSM